MKLYAWVPEGSVGQYAIVVAADSEIAARAAAEAEVQSIRASDPALSGHYLRGWGTDHYALEVREAECALAVMIG